MSKQQACIISTLSHLRFESFGFLGFLAVFEEEDVRLRVWGGPVGVDVTEVEDGGIRSSELVDLSSSAWTRLRAPAAPQI